MSEDYYKILGIDSDSSQTEVKKAYRSLARKYHPDANPDDPQANKKFLQLKEAFDILSDPLERDKYDNRGNTNAVRPPPSPPTNAERPSGGNPPAPSNYYDRSQYGSGTPAPPPSPPPSPMMGAQSGADLKYDLEITFDESIYGLETDLEIPVMVECKICLGTGIRPGAPHIPCSICGGVGDMENMYGGSSKRVVCNNCQGTGISAENLCASCNGNGRVGSHRNVFVKVPPGVENGARLRIRGMGEPGIQGGPAGDLYVMIFILEHDIFERHGNEVLCEVSITFLQAVLGAQLEVPILKGKETIKIPPGTQNGTIFRLKGRGVPDVRNGERGDQHIKVTVVTPTGISRSAKNLLWKFGKAIGEDTSSILMRQRK